MFRTALVIASLTAGMSLSGIFPPSVTELFPVLGAGVVCTTVVSSVVWVVGDGWLGVVALGDGVWVVTEIVVEASWVVLDELPTVVVVCNEELEPMLDATVVNGRKSTNMQFTIYEEALSTFMH